MHVCMYVCMYVCTYVCLRVCVCAKVVVIKARGNVAVDLKLMMCSSGYCVWLEAIDTHTHVHACAYTYKHGWYLSLTIVYMAPKQRRHANIQHFVLSNVNCNYLYIPAVFPD